MIFCQDHKIKVILNNIPKHETNLNRISNFKNIHIKIKSVQHKIEKEDSHVFVRALNL